jgi:nicotinamide riboside kinase
MKIAISGAHSQGKTTLINDLKIQPIFRKFSILGNITRGIQERGVPINELGSDWSQSLVIAKHIEHYFYKGDAILDRCILDGVVYTDVLHQIEKRVSDPVREFAVHTFKELALKKRYDVIFYVEPTLPLVTDNVRSTDVEFFNHVKSFFKAYIDGYGLKVIPISGSREERVKMIINTLQERYNLQA